MLRTFFFLAAAVAIAVLTSGGQSAGPQPNHAEHFAKCAKTCADCQLECDTCTKHCLTLAAEGKKEHIGTAQICADCAECCRTCSALCARQGPLSRYMLECCAKCCDDCAASCERFRIDARMAMCARVCQDCSKECRQMLKNF